MREQLRARAAKIWSVPVEETSVGGRPGAMPVTPATIRKPLTLAEHRRDAGENRRTDRRPRVGESRRWRDRPSPRTSATSRSIRETGCSRVVRYTAIQDVGQGDASELRRRADAGRRGAGHRLGAQRGVHLQREGRDGERRLPRLPDAGRVGPADDRHGHRRGAEPAHPYGVRGVGEVPIVPPLAAVANAMPMRPASASPSCRCRRRACSNGSTRGGLACRWCTSRARSPVIRAVSSR